MGFEIENVDVNQAGANCDISPRGSKIVVIAKKRVYKGLMDVSKEEDKERVTEGFIVNTGPDVSEDTNIGDEIIFGKFAGHEITRNEVEYWMMKEEDILADITDNDKEHDVKKGGDDHG